MHNRTTDYAHQVALGQIEIADTIAKNFYRAKAWLGRTLGRLLSHS